VTRDWDLWPAQVRRDAALAPIRESTIEVTIAISDRFTPIVKKVSADLDAFVRAYVAGLPLHRRIAFRLRARLYRWGLR
jgi:hypothetical protein